MIYNVQLLQKTLAIIDCMYTPFDPTKSCQGGSETWILETAKIFTKNNWHVVVFANVQNIMIYEGIEYIPFNILEYRCKYQVFDLVIFSRNIMFSNKIICKHKFVMFHDLGFSINHKIDNIDSLMDLIYLDKINEIERFYFLSKYQKEFVNKKETFLDKNDNNIFLSILNKKSYYTHNGINYDLYKIKYKKEHSMVWSSNKDRGFDFFIDYVMPEILLNVPDFILHVCSYDNYVYNNINDKVKNHIIFYGKLEKNILAELQSKSKIWCYPNLGYTNYNYNNFFTETFCITAIENLVADNVLIVGDLGGLQTTLEGYPLVGREFYNSDNKIPLEKLFKYGKYLAKYCIDGLLDRYKPEYKGDINKFTWDNVFKEFTKSL